MLVMFNSKRRVQYGLVHISVGDLLREQVAARTDAGNRAKEFMDSGNLVPDEVVVQMVVSRLSQDDVKQAGWLLDGYPRSKSQAAAIVKENIEPDVFLLINVPDEVIVDRVTGRRSDPETGDIYHMTHKPPPPEIQDRLVQVRECLHLHVYAMRGCRAIFGVSFGTFQRHRNAVALLCAPCCAKCQGAITSTEQGARAIQRSDDTEEKAKNRIQVYHDNVELVTAFYQDKIMEVDGNTSMDTVFEQVKQALDQKCFASV